MIVKVIRKVMNRLSSKRAQKIAEAEKIKLAEYAGILADKLDGAVVEFWTNQGRKRRTGMVVGHKRGRLRVRLLGLPGNEPTLCRRTNELTVVGG